MAGVKMRIGALDAGLVFRVDGTMEAFLPRVREQAEVADNMVVGMVLFWASQRPDVLQRLTAEMHAEDLKLAS
jgi:hypothetical protein